jgi:hypothetical protein
MFWNKVLLKKFYTKTNQYYVKLRIETSFGRVYFIFFQNSKKNVIRGRVIFFPNECRNQIK